MALTAKQLKKPKPGRYSDGNGLFLHVRESGSQSWTLRVQFDGTRRDYGLGSLLSLAEARERASIWRKWAKDGLDPRREWAKGNTQVPTFEEAAREYHKVWREGRKNGKHIAQWIRTLECYAFPRLGKRSVDTIGSPEVLAVLRPIWTKKAVTAGRVKQRIARVLNYANSQGWRDDSTPVAAIDAGLPDQKHKPKHFKAVPYRDMPDLWSKLDAANSQNQTAGRTALALNLLTGSRPGEIRGMVWGELDLEGGKASDLGFDGPVWAIPADRYKTERLHIVPLPSAAVAILRELRGMLDPEPSELVIQGARRGRPISNSTMNRVLSNLGFKGFTVHGTARSGLRDWAGEEVRARREVCEAALGHVVTNQSERAYARATYVDERAELMERWADYLTGEESNVLRLAVGQL